MKRILDAACALFIQTGIQATTLDQIGLAAGVGRSQLYHFFADKADLVADVVAAEADRLLALVRPATDSMMTADDLVAFCEGIVAAYDHGSRPIRCPLGSLVHQLHPGDNRAWTTLQAGFAEWETLLRSGLQRIADGGELGDGADTDVLAAGFLAAFQGGVLLAEVKGDVEPLRRALQLALAAVPIART